MPGITSASGLLSLLDEHEDDKLKVYALEKLNTVVDQFWAEIADNIQQIEVLNENEAFEARELAALVASKVYYHIGSFKSAMIYALAAGRLFDINEDSFYAKTLVAKCIDEYVRQRSEGKEQQEHEVPLKGLEKIVDAVFDNSYLNGEYKYALGVAIETKRLDRLEETIKRSGQEADLLDYAFSVCMDVVVSRDFRQTLFGILVRLYRELAIPNWTRMCEILIFLDDAASVAQILNTLLKSDDGFLLAYQIAFNLCKNASQQFRLDVKKEVVSKLEVDAEQTKIQEFYEQMVKHKQEEERRRAAGEPMEVDTTPKPSPTPAGAPEQDPKVVSERLANMKSILSGQSSTNLFLEFLHRNNHSDKLILHNIKTAMDSKSSIVYSSILICHGFMNCGTTNDFFLRDNLEWLSKATNWSKFTATASLGVVQQGHFKEGLSLLAPYLPQQGQLSSPYSEGGALYALGLIHANHGDEITDYLRAALVNAGTNEIVQSGACLGLGVAAMATRNLDIFEDLKGKVLFTDSAVAGEAAGLAMGLVMLGSASDKALEDMLAYAHDTQHEKIIRGLAVGIALIMACRLEEADTLIQTMVLDKDPILRYGGMYTIALAYCGTSNDAAIRRLLHVAVSDVSNDVRRAAVLALGFVLLNQPEQCPKLVNLLAESYNPHVRYGAAMAVGISCAGTGLKSAVDLLEPLLGDGTDFVRQGALIAVGMVLTQISKAQEPRVEKVRKLLADTIADKHEDIMAKFGACIATGIIDGGGRNCSIIPRSPSGHIDTTAIIGLALFTQYWYWHPLAHFLSLSFTPTAIIGLNKDLKMPVFKFKSNARPSLFAYPPKVKPPATKTLKKMETAELSITKKAKIRQQQKDKEKNEREGGGKDDMDVDKKEEKKEEGDKMDVDKEKATDTAEDTEGEKVEEPPEPEFEELSNPARVTMRQLEFISFSAEERYIPVQSSAYGILLLTDRTPGIEEVFVTPGAPPAEVEDDGDEPEPPQPFDYDPEKEKD